MEYRVIFDHAGGITLQLGGVWAHHYLDPKAAARDYREYIDKEVPESEVVEWEGHEDEALDCEPTAAEIRSGGYRVIDRADQLNPESSWANEATFCASLEGISSTEDREIKVSFA